VPKRKRREHQHQNQAPQRRRAFGSPTLTSEERLKPPFPMNLFQNTKLFFIIGAVIMIGGVIAAALLGSQNPGAETDPDFEPTPTATSSITPDGTTTVTPTPAPKSFTQADQVINAQTNSYQATLKTNKGDIVIKLNADVAPNTVNSFAFLAGVGYFNGVRFHRVVSNFVIQGGDPTGSGSGGPGYQTNDEPNQIPNKKYTISMAKTAGATNFGSQFFINLKDNPSLDFNNGRGDKFYPFGEVISGQDVVDAIGAVRTDGNGRPVEPVIIQSLTIQETAR
jgi:cyclophilin family peptidyl-prolyl cis-trans isomerase